MEPVRGQDLRMAARAASQVEETNQVVNHEEFIAPPHHHGSERRFSGH
jgi:hypothetical protein